MFFIERLIGIGTYVAMLALLCLFMRRATSSKTRHGLEMIYFLVLVVLAFIYVPYKTMDLYRLLLEIHRWVKEYSWKDIFNIAIKSSTPGWYIYGYALASTGIDGLVPACTAVIVYANVFRICETSIEKCQLNRLDAEAVFFYIMSIGEIFILTISNVRTAIGISIIARCAVEEIYQEKKFVRNILWYAIAASFHQFCFIACALRITAIFFEMIVFEKQMWIRNLPVVLFLGVVFLFLLNQNNSMNYMTDVIGKVTYYLSQNVYDYFWERLIGIFNILFVLISIRYARKYGLYSKVRTRKVLIFLWVLLIAEMLFGREYAIFRRTSVLMIFVSVPIVAEVLSVYESRKSLQAQNNYRNFLWINSWVVLALECVRGDLCGYKFF